MSKGKKSSYKNMTGKANIGYFKFRNSKITETKEIASGIFADYDKKGRLVGIEIVEDYEFMVASFKFM